MSEFPSIQPAFTIKARSIQHSLVTLLIIYPIQIALDPALAVG
jgi:hypothetical protein